METKKQLKRTMVRQHSKGGIGSRSARKYKPAARSAGGEGGKFAWGRRSRSVPARCTCAANASDQQWDTYIATAVGARSARKCKPAGLSSWSQQGWWGRGEGGKCAWGRWSCLGSRLGSAWQRLHERLGSAYVYLGVSRLRRSRLFSYRVFEWVHVSSRPHMGP